MAWMNWSTSFGSRSESWVHLLMHLRIECSLTPLNSFTFKASSNATFSRLSKSLKYTRKTGKFGMKMQMHGKFISYRNSFGFIFHMVWRIHKENTITTYTNYFIYHASSGLSFWIFISIVHVLEYHDFSHVL